MSLEEIIKQKKKEGFSVVEIVQYLRDKNMQVPFVIVRKIYLEV